MIKRDTLGRGWLIATYTSVCVVLVAITCLIVFGATPVQFTLIPGDQGGDVFGINFFEPALWTLTLLTLFGVNTFAAALESKLSMWRWGIVSTGGASIDAYTLGLLAANEFLTVTLPLASIAFSLLNISFLLAYISGRTAGTVLLFHLNYKA
jgi:hypothetical protein